MGTSLAVWEVVMLADCYDRDPVGCAATWKVETVLAYAKAYPAEIVRALKEKPVDDSGRHPQVASQRAGRRWADACPPAGRIYQHRSRANGVWDSERTSGRRSGGAGPRVL